MAYRESQPSAPPRVLVVRPQRAPTSAIFMGLGVFFLTLVFYGAGSSLAKHGVTVVLVGLLAAAAFASIFLVSGLHGWLLRVDISQWDDGMVTLSWARWPFRPRTTTIARADVLDVVIESDDGTSKIVIVTKGEPIPLTGSATSDDLSRKVAEMKAFLGLG